MSNQDQIGKKIQKILNYELIDVDIIIRTLTITFYNHAIPYYSYLFTKRKIKNITYKIENNIYIVNDFDSTEMGKTPMIKELEVLYLKNVSFLMKIIAIINQHIIYFQKQKKNLIIVSSRINFDNLPVIPVNIFDTIENRTKKLQKMEIDWGFEIDFDDSKEIIEKQDYLDKHRFFLPYKKNTKIPEFKNNNMSLTNIVDEIIKHYQNRLKEKKWK